MKWESRTVKKWRLQVMLWLDTDGMWEVDHRMWLVWETYFPSSGWLCVGSESQKIGNKSWTDCYRSWSKGSAVIDALTTVLLYMQSVTLNTCQLWTTPWKLRAISLKFCNQKRNWEITVLQPNSCLEVDA